MEFAPFENVAFGKIKGPPGLANIEKNLTAQIPRMPADT